MGVARTRSNLVDGRRAQAVKARLWLRVAWLALARGRPGGAWQRLRGLVSLARRLREGQRIRRFARVRGAYAWDLHLPYFPSPAFDGFVEGELERLEDGSAQAPDVAVFAITRRCGLRCEHCFEWEVLNKPEALSAEELRLTLAGLLELGVTQIFFSGGEPLARLEDLLDLIRRAGPNTQCWVITAGPGLSADTALRLRQAGLVGLVLSLDHWDPKSHDAFRGRAGAFDHVAQGARHAREAGLAVALGLCPTREFTTEENLETYRRVGVELGADFIQVMEPRAEGRYEGQDVDLSPGQLGLLEDFYQRLCFGAAANPIVSYPALMSRRVGCQGGGERYLYVDTEGAAHACPFCKESAGSFVHDDPGNVLARLRAKGCPTAGGGRACGSRTSVQVPAVLSSGPGGKRHEPLTPLLH